MTISSNIPRRLKAARTFSDKGLVRLCNLQVGDKLLGDKGVWNEVKEISRKKYRGKFYLINGHTLVFQDQSIYLHNRSIRLPGELALGDFLAKENNSWEEVTSLEVVEGKYRFYHPTLDGDKTFFLNGILVHNATNNFNAVSGEWNTAGNWSLTHNPLSTEDTTFTGLDGSGALTITTTAAVAKSVDFSTAGAVFTLSGSPNLTISGSLTCKTGMAWSHTGILRPAYYVDGVLTSNGVDISASSYLHIYGASLTLSGALNRGTKPLSIVSGATLITGDNTITCGIFGDGNSASSVTLTLGTSTINCSNISFATSTLTVTGTPTVNLTSTADTTAHFGGQTWGGTTTVLMTGGKILTLNGANTFDKFALSWTSDNILSALVLGADQTFSNVTSDALKITGASIISRPFIKSDVPGTHRHITAATINITGAMDFRDIYSDNAMDLSGTASGNCGGNTGITFRTADDYYADCGTQNRDITNDIWATASGGGAGGTGAFPLTQDTIVIDNTSWDDTGNTFTVTGNHRVGKIDASGLTEANTVHLDSAYHYGSLILTGAGVTVTSTHIPYFDARVRDEASESLSLNCPTGMANFTIESYGGVVQLAVNTIVSDTATLNKGTFSLNGFTLTAEVWSSSNVNTRDLLRGASTGKIVATGLTGTIFNMATTDGLTVTDAPNIDIGDSNNTQTNTVTFAGGGKTFGDFKITKHAGNYACIITGANTFGVFTLETPDVTYQYSEVNFTAATQTNITDMVADGHADYDIYIHSVTAATHTLNCTSGSIDVTNCTITNSIATGGATFNSLAANGCTDGGGNTGWIFAAGATILVIADGSHALTSDNVALAQVHTLAVAAASHASSSSNIALTQVHGLTIANGDHTHSAGSPTLTQAHTLTVDGSSHALTSDAPVLTQLHNLSVNDTAHALTSDAPVLTQAHALAVNAAFHALTSGNVVLTQAHILAVDNGSHALTSDNVVLNANQLLIIADSSHALTSDNIILTQIHNLSVDDSTHTTTSGESALTQVHNLTVADSDHALTSGTPALIEHKTLAVADAEHALSSDNIGIAQVHSLSISAGSHSHIADSPTLTEHKIIEISNGNHALSSDNPALTQAHTLTVAGGSHTHSADNVTLAQGHLLAVQNSAHALTSDSLTLAQVHALIIANASHSQISNNIDLSQIHNLAILDTNHATTSDSFAIVQNQTLSVNGSNHVVASDGVVLTQSHYLTLQDCLHSLSSDNVVTTTHNPILNIATASFTVDSDNIALLQEQYLNINPALSLISDTFIKLYYARLVDLVTSIYTKGIVADIPTINIAGTTNNSTITSESMVKDISSGSIVTGV